METINKESLDLVAIATHGIIALVFGAMKQLNAIKNTGFKASRFIANAVVSSFVGIAVFFLCMSTIPTQPYLTAFATSIAGWAGGNMMDFFSIAMQKALAKKLDTEVNKSTKEEAQRLADEAMNEIINNK